MSAAAGRTLRSLVARPARTVTAGAVSFALAVTGYVALAPAAHSTGALTATSVSLGASSVSVSGLAAGSVSVTARVTIDTAQVDPTEPLVARLVRTSPAANETDPVTLWALLPRTGGADAAHGTYAGQLVVPSTANGAWRLDRITTYLFGGNPNLTVLETDPRADGVPERTLTVVGTHRPVLTLTQSPVFPLPRPTGLVRTTFTGTVRYSDTGAPVRGFAVNVAADSTCVEGSGAPNRTTGAAGTFTATLSLTANTLFCVTTPLPGTPTDQLRFRVYHRLVGLPLAAVRLSAAVSPTTIPLGAQAAVTGSVRGLYGGSVPLPHVRLQKLVGGRWVTVNTAPVRASGRYTLAARPGARGTSSYRVWFPTQRPYKGTVSATVRLTVR